MSGEIRVCRFCRGSETRLLKYDVRHYAHTDCFLREKGFKRLMELPVGALANVRVGALTRQQLQAVMERLDMRHPAAVLIDRIVPTLGRRSKRQP